MAGSIGRLKMAQLWVEKSEAEVSLDGNLPGCICNYGRHVWPNKCEDCSAEELCRNGAKH